MSRILKVYYHHFTDRNRTVPLIRLQGAWLEKLGFTTGSKLKVSEQEGQLTITLIKE